jgi:hypothetical protein
MTSHTMRSCDFARVISRSWRCWYGRQREKISRWTVRDFSYGHVWKATPAARSVNQSSTRAGIPFPEALSSFPRPWETETRTCKGKERKKENILAQQERLLGTYLAPKYGSNCTTAQTHFGRRDVRQVGHEYKIRTRSQPKLALSHHRLAPCKPLINHEIKPERESLASGVPGQGQERTDRERSEHATTAASFIRVLLSSKGYRSM